MEVDPHSPSFRTTRPCPTSSSKRARSPETPSSLDRPAKRLSLAVNTAQPSGIYPLSSVHVAASPVSGSRPHSEDWVQQAGGLTIDSPSYAVSSESITHDAGEEALDENMSMDPDENQTEKLCGLRQRTSYSQTSNTQAPRGPSGPAARHDLEQQQQQYRQTSYPSSAQRPHSYPAGHIMGLQSSSRDINIDPLAPISSHDLSLNFSTQSSSSAVGNAISAPDSPSLRHGNGGSLCSSKKQRFTMGPRVDCEKCRLGVKGHWMHLN